MFRNGCREKVEDALFVDYGRVGEVEDVVALVGIHVEGQVVHRRDLFVEQILLLSSPILDLVRLPDLLLFFIKSFFKLFSLQFLLFGFDPLFLFVGNVVWRV